MRRAFYKAVHSYESDLVKYIDRVGDQFDAKAVHELRATFKKLRAILRWQKVDKKTFTSFKKVYHLAGEIRIIQVAMAMLEKERGTAWLRPMKVWLSNRLRDKKKEWDKLYVENALQQLKFQLENINVSPRVHKNFFLKRIETINFLVNAEAISDEALHDIRKMTKDMEYVLESGKTKCEESGLPKQITATRLKLIAKDIGSFNDIRMLVGLLTEYAKNKNPAFLNSAANSPLGKWQQKKETLKKQLVKGLRRIGWGKSKKSKVKIQK